MNYPSLPPHYKTLPKSDTWKFNDNTQAWEKYCNCCQQYKPLDRHYLYKQKYATSKRCLDCQKLPINSFYQNGIVYKGCSICDEEHPLEHYPKRKGLILAFCQKCFLNTKVNPPSYPKEVFFNNTFHRYCVKCEDWHTIDKFTIFRLDQRKRYCDESDRDKFCKCCQKTKDKSEFRPLGKNLESYCRSCKNLQLLPGNRKKCKKCKIIKSLDYFYPSTRGGYTNQCIDCISNVERVKNVDNTRLCGNCRQWKPLIEFGKYRRSNKLDRNCKVCKQQLKDQQYSNRVPFNRLNLMPNLSSRSNRDITVSINGK